jgi:hypothetical protein
MAAEVTRCEGDDATQTRERERERNTHTHTHTHNTAVNLELSTATFEELAEELLQLCSL